MAPVVDAFKFDLKAATPGGWARLTKVKDPAPAHDATVRAKEVHGCHVEVVSNIVPGFNDDEGSLLGMAQWVRDRLGAGTPWHVTRFVPAFELSYLSPTPIKTLERAVRVGKSAGLRFVYVGNVPDHIGRHTMCPRCGRTVIRRTGSTVDCAGLGRGLCLACGEDLGVVQA